MSGAKKSVTILTTGLSSSGGQDSCASSLVGLEPISLLQNCPHPEQWTIPQEWNIEQRELYQNWKMDVQKQISTLNRQLYSSLQSHPQDELGQYVYVADRFDRELRARQEQDQDREPVVGKMVLGLKRD